MRALLRNVGRVTVCQVVGNLEFATAADFRSALADLGARHLVLDLSGMAFIDSTGVGALLGALRRAREHGGDVVLCSPRPSVSRVLGLVGIGRLVPIAASVDEAVTALSVTSAA
jgi:anti-sigma B factor antagonist